MSQSGSEKIQRIYPYGKPFKFISLPNVMHKYLELDLDFYLFIYFILYLLQTRWNVFSAIFQS